MVFLNTVNNKCGLVIGINYEDDLNAKLNGCINDTKKICNFLKKKCQVRSFFNKLYFLTQTSAEF